MRPAHDDDDAAIELLRARLPEFEAHYRDLLDMYDEDLTASTVVMELADFVGHLLRSPDREPLLERTLDAVDDLVQTSANDRQLVAEFFLSELPPLAIERMRPLLGPACAELVAEMERRSLRDQIPGSAPERRR